MGDTMSRRKFVGVLGVASACAVGVGSGLIGCSSSASTGNPSQVSSTNVLWEKSATADKIVVVSDLHFGVDDRFAQTVADRSLFVDFVDALIAAGDVRELVIAGDFLDEWIVPMSYPAHTDSDAFYRQCVSNNQQVFDELVKAIDSGIRVVYVPGNHDMTLTEEVLAQELPGVAQARDATGLGVHITGDRNEIAIEHCHRYDVYSAPDTISNRDLAEGGKTMLPPGYFYAQLGTEWAAEGKPSNKVDYPQVNAPASSDMDQMGAYLHYKVMTNVLLTQYTPSIGFDQQVMQAAFDGLKGPYSEYDLCPRLMDDGTISAPTLYRNFQRTWDDRQGVNKVRVKLPFIEAAMGTSKADYFRSQAARQYLENPGSGIDVVVFGHTHIPDFHDFGNGKYYVNDGTWIDENLDADPELTRTFAVITTGDVDSAVLYQYGKDGSISDVTAGNIDA
jgi:UDP-2,3-diacylglucosamine pyrophosphatase LpxH